MELNLKVTQRCFIMPPPDFIFGLSDMPSPESIISELARSKGVDSPLSYNTLKKVISVRPEGTRKSFEKMEILLSQLFPGEVERVHDQAFWSWQGSIGYGAVRWLITMPQLRDGYSDILPYTLEVLNNLIELEHQTVSEALEADISPYERQSLVLENESIRHLFSDINLNAVMRNDTHPVASLDGWSTGMCFASVTLYLLASVDAELTKLTCGEVQAQGLLGRLIPTTYSRKGIYRSYWETLLRQKQLVSGIPETWISLERFLLMDDPDSARRTLNRYKKGDTPMPMPKLVEFLDRVFGEHAEQFTHVYLYRLRGVHFIANLFDALRSAPEAKNSWGLGMSDKDVSDLVAIYNRHYAYHCEALGA